MNDEGKKESNSGALEPSKQYKLAELLDYAPGAIVSRTLIKRDVGTVTRFSFDEGQELSEHSAPYDAMVNVLDGEAEVIIAGESVITKAGETVIMPANIPHAVKASKRFKMLLVMIRG